MKSRIAFLFSLFPWQVLGEEAVIRGFSLERLIPPPIVLSNDSNIYAANIYAGYSRRGIVWAVTSYSTPRKTILWLQTPNGEARKLTELPYGLADLYVVNDIVSIGAVNDQNVVDGVWWINLASGKSEEIIHKNKSIIATFTPAGLLYSLTAKANIVYFTFCVPPGYVGLIIELPSGGRYGGIFQYLGDDKFNQVIPASMASLNINIWPDDPIIEVRNKLYYREIGSLHLTETHRLVEYDLSNKTMRRIFDASQLLFGEKIVSLPSELIAKSDEDKTRFLIPYQTIPWNYQEWWNNHKNRLIEVSLQGEIKQIYSVDWPIEEFGQPWDVNIGAVAKTFAILTHHEKGPAYLPVGVGDYYGAQYYIWAPVDFLTISNGKTIRPFLKRSDLLGGRKIAKFGPAVAYGCQTEILVFGEYGAPDLWRLRMPCILSAPQEIRAGDVLTLTGDNFTAGNPAKVEILTDDILVQPEFIANNRITLRLPVNVTGLVNLAVRLTYSSGETATSNSVPIQITGPPPPPPPIFTPQAIVNGATFRPGISPGGLATIFGQNLASREAKAESLPLPTNLAGVQVTFDGWPAPLWYVSPNQINLQVPLELGAPADVRVQVNRDGVKSDIVMVHLDPVSPGVFQYNGFSIISHSDYRLVTPEAPLRPGEKGIIWATGLGLTNPPAETGKASPRYAQIVNPITLTIGSKEAEILFAGLAPDLVGVYQINFLVPQDISSNDAILVVSDKECPLKIPLVF